MSNLQDISNITIKEIKKNKIDSCQELKNIEYKTMLMNGSNIIPKIDNSSTTNTEISDYLHNEKCANKKECWTKLDKTEKIKHIYNYTIKLQNKYNLTDSEIIELNKYLIKCMDRKYLLKTKEVIYDKNEGYITNLPFLFFNEINRKFTLKKDDKHVSTIKSLPDTKKNKTIKLQDLDN